MKLIAVIALCFLASGIKAGVVNEEILEKTRTASVDCAKESGATEADVHNTMKYMPAQNRESKCLRSCMMKTFNLMNADGKFDNDVAVKMAEQISKDDPEKLQTSIEVATVCSKITVPDDHCEAAELYMMCMVAEAKKHGVDVTAE